MTTEHAHIVIKPDMHEILIDVVKSLKDELTEEEMKTVIANLEKRRESRKTD